MEMPAADQEARVMEPKCSENHPLQKSENFYCDTCKCACYPDGEYHYFQGEQKFRKTSVLNNYTTSFVTMNEKGETVDTRVKALEKIVA